MKKLILIFCLCTMASAGFAQGLINFFNNANTLISVSTDISTLNPVPITGPVGSYYFALLTAPTNSSTFTFSGIYGTNQTVAGRFTGGANIAVNGWAAGTTMQFEVACWTSNLGAAFNSSWLTAHPSNGLFGVSSFATGQAGGFNGTGTLPSLNIFGGATGIQSGFAMAVIPEPSPTTLTVAGVAMLLLFHRKARSAVLSRAKS